MIVRARPRSKMGRHMVPLTVRERHYVVAAWPLYSGRRIVKHLKGNRARLQQIVQWLGLPNKKPGPGTSQERDEVIYSPMIRRCQDCYQLYGRESCPCNSNKGNQV